MEPGTLVRTPEGRITFWSDELHQRYGWSADDALGQIAHELLRSSYWQSRSEIEASLAADSEWRGGLIAYRADDRPVIVANHWRLHRVSDASGSLVTEVHADVLPSGSAAGHDLADVVTTFAQELSEPLTALGGYISGTRRLVQSAWPEQRSRLDHGLSAAAAQLDRATRVLTRIRALGETLRDPRLREQHARLVDVVNRTERLARQAREIRSANNAIREASASVRQQVRQSREQRLSTQEAGAASAERALALQAVEVYRRRLALLASEPADPQTERVLAQLLREEEAKLTVLDQAGAVRGK